jgi:MFS family permease
MRDSFETMSQSLQAGLDRNLKYYAWFKVFTRRVYYPMIVILLVRDGSVTVAQIAVITAVTAILEIALQVPTGYIADKYGNKLAITTGAVLTAASPLWYVFLPSFFGGLVASLFYFSGLAFLSGALEAFIHDCLKVLNKEDDYVKVMGRAQSYSLIGNAILLAVVPATYTIDKRLPFIIGFFTMAWLVVLALKFTYPVVAHTTHVSPLAAAKNILSRKTLLLFIIAGITTGVALKGGEYRELLYVDLKIPDSLFGVLMALSSLLGAVFGRYLPQLERATAKNFYLVDAVILSGCLILSGLTRVPVIAVAAFTMLIAYVRVRQILYQSRLLKEIDHRYKATLISTMSLSSSIGAIFIIAILSSSINLFGIVHGHAVFGIIVLACSVILYALRALILRNSAKVNAVN